MDIMELGAIGELVGGVAVIATLIYLAIQIRQSRRTVEVESMRSVAAESARTIENFVNRENALLFRRGVSGFDALSNNDKWRFHCLMTSFFISGQTTALLRSSDNPSRLEAMCASFARTPELGRWWQTARMAFNQNFVRALETADSAPVQTIMPWLHLEEDELELEER